MKKAIFCIVILLNLPAAAIDYNDFPHNMQQLLDERTDEVTANGGICIAGRVKMNDGAHISSGEDVKINFLQRCEEHLWVYDGGWFVMDRDCQPASRAQPGKLVLRAFGYDPIDASIDVLKGQITYVEFEMDKTPPEKLSSITGIIVNEQNEPINGARIRLSFPLPYKVINGPPEMSTKTGPDGQYAFEDLSITKHHIVVSASGYAPRSADVTPPEGETAIKDFILHRNLGITIDYVYQADGSRSFTDGDLQTGTIEWFNGRHEGVDFSDGRAKDYDPQSLRDIEITQSRDMLDFSIFYCNGQQNGFYDAGDMDFESVTEATQTGYSTTRKPCIVGNTYVVRTYENNYAKFIVRSISEE